MGLQERKGRSRQYDGTALYGAGFWDILMRLQATPAISYLFLGIFGFWLTKERKNQAEENCGRYSAGGCCYSTGKSSHNAFSPTAFATPFAREWPKPIIGTVAPLPAKSTKG